MPERFTPEETLASMQPDWKPVGPSHEAIAATLGKRYGMRRYEMGFTQGMVGERAGLSVSFLSDFQNGKRGISAENLLRLAVVLECTPDWFYGELVEPLHWRRR